MPTVTTPRGTFYVADYRRPRTTGTPTLLIHGAGGAHLDMPAPLRKNAALQPIAPDLSGHGRSAGAGQRSISEYALDVLAVADALGVAAFNALGHSMGGAIALSLALIAPERVQRLILIATAPVIPVNPQIIAGFQTDPAATAQRIAAWMWPKGTADEVIAQSAQRMTQTRPSVILNDYTACDRFDVRDRLSEITTPTLIVHGGQDRMIRASEAEQLAASLPHSTLKLLPQAGHMVHMEHADEVSALIAAWLSSAAL